MDYIAKERANPSAAKGFLDVLHRKLDVLKSFPEAYPIMDEEPWKRRGIRKMVVKGFVAFYSIDVPGKTVFLLAIVYGGRGDRQRTKDL